MVMPQVCDIARRFTPAGCSRLPDGTNEPCAAYVFEKGVQMQRYYFDLVDGDVRAIDEEGLELKYLHAVREETKSLVDMIRDTLLETPQRRTTIWR
ncbi:hypothetical protein M2202_010090 [Bradyrhizobium japonicum]|jgi:hypothetical protein|nr:hypothetical protein [Bradyrhizobium japonicum]